MRRTTAGLGAMALLAIAHGCTRPATQLLVTVDTDLRADQYGCIGVLVAAYDGVRADPTATRRFFAAPRDLSVPFSFGVTPPSGDATVRVEVAAEALPTCDDPPPDARLVRRAVRTGFIPSHTLPITLFLPAECDGCAVDETCGEIGAGCAPIPTYEPSELLTSDASVMRPDASVPDASIPDAAALDAITLDAFVEPPMPPRPIAPLSTATADSRRPLFRWELAAGTDGARIRLCRDQGCADVVDTIDAMGDRARPSTDLPTGPLFWQLAGQSSAVTGDRWTVARELWIGAAGAGDGSSGSAFDLDLDGAVDLAVAAPFAGAGEVYVYASATTEPPATLIAPAGASWFGWSIASGDLDGDGFAELAVGAPSGAGALGTVDVYRHRDGAGAELDPTAIAHLEGPIAGARMGWVVAAGDLDGDGYADLAIGSSFGTGTDPGTVWIHRGGPTGPSVAPSATISGLATNDQFGQALAIGDFDGDGLADLAVGAFRSARVHLFHGDASGTPSPWTTLDAPDPGDFGVAVANVGDVDGDGLTDLAVGSTGYSSGRGRVYVFRGAVGGPATPAFAAVTGAAMFGYFGNTVSGGDVDGDGASDVLVGSSNNDRTFLYLGGAGGLGTPSTFAGPASSGFGTAAVILGDTDADGRIDLAIGAPHATSNAGQTGVYLGSGTGFSASASRTFTGPAGGIGRMGYAVVGAR